MRKRRTVLAAAGSVAVAVAVIAVLCRSKEPSCNGHSLTYWTTHYEDLRDKGPDTPGIRAIAQIGTNALPFLLEWINYNPAPSRLKNAATKILGWLPRALVPEKVATWASEDQKEARATGALWAIVALGPQARSALPELFRRMNVDGAATNQSGISACLALYHTASDDMLPLYLARLANTNAPNRAAVATLIGQCPLATNAEKTITAFIPYLGEDNPGLRQSTADALCRQASQHQFLVPALTNAFASSTNSRLRADIVWILCRVGQPEANAAQPLLLATLQDPHTAVRLQTAKSIPHFGLRTADALPLLTNLLSDAIVHDAASNAIYIFTTSTPANVAPNEPPAPPAHF